MHVAPQLSVGTAYKPDTVQPRGVSMIMSSDSTAVPYGMVPQFSTLQIGSSVNNKKRSIQHVNRFQLIFDFLFPPQQQYISPPYPYYPPSIIHTMQMGESEHASNAASPDEAYTQYQHGPK